MRGEVEFAWSGEADHVIQRPMVHAFIILPALSMMKTSRSHMSFEQLNIFPTLHRQIFIAQSLGYTLPVYAHLPYVAEPNGTAKLSKRKLDKYLKDSSFKNLNELGNQIAALTNVTVTPEVFNPVVVDFYREIGFLPPGLY